MFKWVLLAGVVVIAGCATPGGDSKFALECGDNTKICIMNVADRQSGVSGTDRQIITDPDNVKVGSGQVETEAPEGAIITDPDNVSVEGAVSDGVLRRVLGTVQ